MKKGLRLSLILTCLLFFVASKPSFAQLPQTIEFGPHVGITTYQGDVNPWLFFNEFGYSVGGLVRYTYDTRWAFRADYSFGYVQGSDAKAGWRPERGHAFRTKLHDVALIAEFNFMDYYTGRRESSISPYLFAGLSAFKYKAGAYPLDSLQQVQFTGITPDVNLLKSRWYYRQAFHDAATQEGWSMSIPFGFGCKFSLTEHLAASVEWRMHYTFTDDLDGIVRDGSGRSLYPTDDAHQYFVRTGYKVKKKDSNGEFIVDESGQAVIYDHFEYAVMDGAPSPVPFSVNDESLVPVSVFDTFSYDLTDPTGTFTEGQQRGDGSTNDWFGFLNFTITWKIPIPGNSACKILD